MGRFEYVVLPFLALFWVIPIVITVWFLLKIQSMDSTLKEISRKLDKITIERNAP